jgi:hypothetical protein
MFSLDLDEFMFELKDGALKHVGASNRSATAKLYDVALVDVRAFGDDRIKLGFADGDGNEVEVALFGPEARQVRREIEALEDEGRVFE